MSVPLSKMTAADVEDPENPLIGPVEKISSGGSARAPVSDQLRRPDMDPHLQRHAKLRQVALGKALEGRAAIYLDTRYWIILRDAQRGILGVRAAELLGRLRGAVRAGQAFCPLSESAFLELLKQNDAQSRRETAALMDELSLGVALIGSKERMGTEVAHLIHTHAPAGRPEMLHPLEHLVWSKIGCVVALAVPEAPGLPAEMLSDLHQAIFDGLWDETSVVDLVDTTGPTTWIADDAELAGLSAQLNRDVAAHQGGLVSFKKAYDDEVSGAADICGDVAMAIIADMARSQGIEPELVGTPKWHELRRLWCGLLAAALRKGPSRQQLQSMHVAAALHAAFRWNKGQQFEANDIYDFEHAGAALGHCQAFFTERALWHMVTAKHVALDVLFDCRVVCEVDDAITYVAGLSSPAAT